MIILGLHFGHDAGVSVLKDGKIITAIERERVSRVKHAATLDWVTIQTALKEAGITERQIDYCAVTSGQSIELVSTTPDKIEVRYELHEAHNAPCSLYERVKDNPDFIFNKQFNLLGTVYHSKTPESFLLYHYFPEHKTIPLSDLKPTYNIDRFLSHVSWNGHKKQNLNWLRDFTAKNPLNRQELRFGFHYPLVISINGTTIPGYYIYHHQAHAASAYYPINANPAAILCHDGGTDNGEAYDSGMVYLGVDNQLLPLIPHHLNLGRFYESIGTIMGLGVVGSAGKLMGLSPYGSPRFFEHRFVGNQFDMEDQGLKQAAIDWTNHCLQMGQNMNYDMSVFKDTQRITEPFNADFAASTQKLFEETLLATTNNINGMLLKAGIRVNDLCYAGGVALNCPANSRLAKESQFENVHIPPGCDDSGLAMGAALALYYNILNHSLPADRPDTYPVYLGRSQNSKETADCLYQYGSSIEWEKSSSHSELAAQLLADDKIIGWFEGRSELGPRALGHRSILANPQNPTNWSRVNTIKNREQWRPLAPMVLSEKASEFFYGCPFPSPHMLFTATVKSESVPAITHTDLSARIQTVEQEDGKIHDVLRYFDGLTGIPVLMNTSFNGPGEPIVDLAEHALSFFMKSNLDALFIDGYFVQKSGQ